MYFTNIASLEEILANLTHDVQREWGIGHHESDISEFVQCMESAWKDVYRRYFFFEAEKYNTDTIGFVYAIRDSLLPLLEEFNENLIKIAVFHRYISEAYALTKYRILCTGSASTLNNCNYYAQLDWSRNTSSNFALCATLAILNKPKATLKEIKGAVVSGASVTLYNHDTRLNFRTGHSLSKLKETFIGSGLIKLEDLLLGQLTQSLTYDYEYHYNMECMRLLPNRLFVENVHTNEPESFSQRHGVIGLPLFPIVYSHTVSKRVHYVAFNELMNTAPLLMAEGSKEGTLTESVIYIQEILVNRLLDYTYNVLDNIKDLSVEQVKKLSTVFPTTHNHYTIENGDKYFKCEEYKLPLQFSLLANTDSVDSKSDLGIRLTKLGTDIANSRLLSMFTALPARLLNLNSFANEDYRTATSELMSYPERDSLHTEFFKHNFMLPVGNHDVEDTPLDSLNKMVRTLRSFVDVFNTTEMCNISMMRSCEDRIFTVGIILKFLDVNNPMRLMSELGIDLYHMGELKENMSLITSRKATSRWSDLFKSLYDYAVIPAFIGMVLDDNFEAFNEGIEEALQNLFNITHEITFKVLPVIQLSIGSVWDNSVDSLLPYNLETVARTVLGIEFNNLLNSEVGFKDGYKHSLIKRTNDRIFKDLDFHALRLTTETIINNLREYKMETVQVHLSTPVAVGSSKSFNLGKSCSMCMLHGNPAIKCAVLDTMAANQRLCYLQVEDFVKNFDTRTVV